MTEDFKVSPNITRNREAIFRAIKETDVLPDGVFVAHEVDLTSGTYTKPFILATSRPERTEVFLNATHLGALRVVNSVDTVEGIKKDIKRA